MYDPFKFPADLEEAKIHQRASGIGTPLKSRPNCKFCHRTQKKSYRIFGLKRERIHSELLDSRTLRLLQICHNFSIFAHPRKPSSVCPDERRGLRNHETKSTRIPFQLPMVLLKLHQVGVCPSSPFNRARNQPNHTASEGQIRDNFHVHLRNYFGNNSSPFPPLSLESFDPEEKGFERR